MNFANKKPSRVLLLLSLLIAAVMVFSACTTTDGVVVGDPVVEDELPQDDVIVEDDTDAVVGDEVVEDEPVVGDADVVDTTTEGVAAIQDVMVTANYLLDFDLENAADEDLGDVQNLLVDPNTGNIPYAIIESSGFLGFDAEDVLIPMDAFYLSDEGDELLLPFATPDEVEGMPVVAEETWEINDGSWDDQFFDFWSGTEYGANLVNYDTNLVLLSDLIGFGTGTWADLGTGLISSILVDLGTNSAKWVVLDYADTGIVDYTDNVVLVPFEAFDWLNMDTELGFSPELPVDALNNAPIVNRDALFAADFLAADFDADAVTYWEDIGYGFE